MLNDSADMTNSGYNKKGIDITSLNKEYYNKNYY